jgi:general secretion pathway protein C
MVDVSSLIQNKFAVIMPRLKVFLRKMTDGGMEHVEQRLVMFIAPIGLAYLLSAIIGGLVAQTLVKSIVTSRAKLAMRSDAQEAPSLDRPVLANSRDLQKIIKERNIFNSEGKFPEEKFGTDGDRTLAKFDIDAPCVDTALPIELLGTIFIGDRFRSLATVKDKAYSEADIYRVGDSIYGNEQAIVAAVDRQRIIINNSGVKECIDLDKGAPGMASDGFPTGPGGDFGSLPNGSGGGGSEITLDASYVEGELGPGFGKIVDAARLVPNAQPDGGINGFKIFAIKGGTLFARIGLQNGDVITQVNEVSMKQAEQGFALYQAFQDEKEVRIQLLRGGTAPQNVSVRIK